MSMHLPVWIAIIIGVALGALGAGFVLWQPISGRGRFVLTMVVLAITVAVAMVVFRRMDQAVNNLPLPK